MEETVVIIMLKEETSGFLTNEIASCRIEHNIELIDSIYAREQNGQYLIYIRLTVGRDVEEWEFHALYDYYDVETLLPEVLEVSEIEDSFNPTWEAVFEYNNTCDLDWKISAILKLHEKEINESFIAAQDNKVDYIMESDDD